MNLPASLSVGLMAAVIAGCASYEHKPVNYQAAQSAGHTATADGVTVAAEAFETKGETIGAFDEDMTEAGIVPVQVLVRNATAANIIVQRDTVQLVDAAGQVHRPVPAVVVSEAVEDNAMAYGLLGFGIFSYASAQEANKERTADYQAKELAEAKIVTPGAEHGAFVYFKLPKGVDPNSSRLKLQVQHVGSNQVTDLELEL
jgi:hypothetical protein